MAEYMVLPIIAGIIVFVIVLFIIFAITGRHKDFISNAKQITNGMTTDEVLSIMGESPTSEERDGDKTIFTWEKSQWKGIQNGGTLVRSVKVVIKNNKVISVATKNLDKSTFW